MNNNLENRYGDINSNLEKYKSMSMGTEFQSGNALIKFKFAESVANSVHRGGYAGYNIASMYKVNPLLDLVGNVTPINKWSDQLAGLVKLGNSNLTEGFNITNNIGLKWVNKETLTKAAANKTAEQNLMHGLNLTFGPNGSETNLFGYLNQKFFNSALSNPLSNSATFNTLKTNTQKVLKSKITKNIAGVGAKALGAASTVMLWETAIDFMEMYNEHIIDSNINKSLSYNSNLHLDLNNERTTGLKNHNLQTSFNNERELSYVLSSVNTAEKYFGG